jgi:hypothetical protein
MLGSETVFVIGAGASKEVGLPVGDELEQFPIRMHHILRRRNNFDIHWM